MGARATVCVDFEGQVASGAAQELPRARCYITKCMFMREIVFRSKLRERHGLGLSPPGHARVTRHIASIITTISRDKRGQKAVHEVYRTTNGIGTGYRHDVRNMV